MGLNLVDASVDGLPLPSCVPAGVSSNRVGLKRKKKKRKVGGGSCSKRERKVFSTDPRVARGSSFWRGAILLERPRHHPNPGRAATLTQASADTRAGGTVKAKISMDGRCSTKGGYTKILCKVLTFTKQSIFLKQNLSPQLMHEVRNFQWITFSKRTINKLSAATRKDRKKNLLK